MVAVTKNPKYKTYKRGEAGSITSPNIGTPKAAATPAKSSSSSSGMSQGVKSPKDAFFGAAQPQQQPQSVMPRTAAEAFFGSVQQPQPQSVMPNTPQEAFFSAAPQAQPQSTMPVSPTGSAPVQAQNRLPAQQNAQQTPSFSGSTMRPVVAGKSAVSVMRDWWDEKTKADAFATLGISLDGYKPPEGVTYTAPMALPGGATLAELAAQYVTKQSALKAAEKGSIKYLNNMERAGQKLMTPEGAQSVAGNIPEAGGVLKEAADAGKVVTNSKTMAETLKQIVQIGKFAAAPLLVAGSVFGLYYGKRSAVENAQIAISDDATAFSLSFVKDEQALRDAGLPELADEINRCAQDVKDALESGDYNNLFTGKKEGMKALNQCKDNLAAGLSQVEKIKAQEAAQKILDAQLAADEAERLRREQLIKDREDQRAYQERQTADQRAYQERQLADQRAYNEQQLAAQQRAQYNMEATATQSAEGSTLTFGLLNTGGATEFVDKDKASQVYYGKNYDELTPQQQMLLNLLKGKGG